MEHWKSFGKKIFILPLWLKIGLTIFSAAALILVFTRGWAAHPYAYAVYCVSFYTFVVFSVSCIRTMPGYYRSIRERLYRNRYAERYLTDAAYKTHVNLYTSLGINLIYAAVNAVSAVIYQTVWFAIFAVYYTIMAFMRFLLVRYVGKNQIGESRLGELRRARVCSYILLTINITLSGVVLMMVYYDRGFEYQGYLIYVMAAYTFYAVTLDIIHMIKYRKYRSPIMSVSKIIKLASSLFSMLFLETAMFSQFGQDTSAETKRIMIMATGAGICVVVVGTSLYMIVHATKEIQEMKR